MSKTPRMLLLEYQRGEPLEQMIVRLYQEHGTHEAVATELGISTVALWNWRMRLGIETRLIAESE